MLKCFEKQCIVQKMMMKIWGQSYFIFKRHLFYICISSSMFDVKPLDISIIGHLLIKLSKPQTDKTVGSMEGVNAFNCLKSKRSLQNFFVYFPGDCGKLFIQVYLLMTSCSNIEILMFCGMSGPSSHLDIMIMLHCVLT